MNAAHFHLIVNHFPIVIFLCAVGVTIYSLCTKSEESQKIALGLIVAGAILALPTYFSGEPAAEFLENSAIVNDMLIEEHEEAAEKSILVAAAAGIMAGATLWLMKNKMKFAKPASLTTAGLTTGAIIMFAWTGSKGGLIRHPEMAESQLDPQRQTPGLFAPGGDLEDSSEEEFDLEFDTEDSDDK